MVYACRLCIGRFGMKGATFTQQRWSDATAARHLREAHGYVIGSNGSVRSVAPHRSHEVRKLA